MNYSTISEPRSIPRRSDLTAAAVVSFLITIEAVPVAEVFIAAALAHSSELIVELNADSFPLMSLKE
jgi:hypothetical protein